MKSQTIIIVIFFIFMFIVFYYFQRQNKNYVINDYLFDENNLQINIVFKNIKKPILWIYIPYEYNSRHWGSFGSRSSFNLNQPYLYLTIQSIVQHCSKDFYICIIDEYSFEKLIPEFSLELNKVPYPIKYNLKILCLLKLLYLYGGLIVPLSFVCFQNLYPLYKKLTKDGKLVVGQNVNNNVSSQEYLFSPDIHFIGSKSQNPILEEIIQYTQIIISTDFTEESIFLGKLNKWCLNNKKVNLISPKELGTCTTDNKAVLIDNLLERNYISFSKNLYGIWIPSTMILNRTAYQWFARMSKEQVLEGNTILSKYILLSLGPGSVPQIKEPVEKKDWISFWKVPSGAPVWGLMPIDLGNNVPRNRDF
jgi:hypothetical protein